MLNKAILIGRLGSDPEFKVTNAGTSMLKFSLATNESYTNKSSGQREEKTQWHQVVTYGKFADTMNQFLSKGMQVYVEGKIETNKVQKPGDVKPTFYTNIVAGTIRRLGNVAAAAQATPRAATPNSYEGGCEVSFEDEDIPF